MKIDAQALIDAAKIDDGYFSIGPYAHRVNFAYQQRRALSTVWALCSQSELSKGARVAVIGGGISGITTAVALSAQAITPVIFEKNNRVLYRQKSAEHRYIHPTINFWPSVELNSTTEFPFLDWHASDCADVIKTLKFQWDKYFSDTINTYLDTDVLSVEKSCGSPRPVFELSFGSSHEVHVQHQKFDAVILCTGFSSERKLGDMESPQYWDDDQLINKEGKAPYKAISGTGDAGIIDAIRSVHINFDHGKIFEKVAMLIQRTGLAHQILAAEEKCDGYPENERHNRHRADYISILNDIQPALLKILNESLQSTSPVYLVGKEDTAFNRRVAPIHKLFLAHAEEQNAIKFIKGEATGKKRIKLPKPLNQKYRNEQVLLRHGPSDDILGKFLTSEQIEHLKSKQNLIGDYLANQAPYTEEYWGELQNYPSRQSKTGRFVQERHILLTTNVKDQYLPLSIQIQFLEGHYYLYWDTPVSGDAKPDRYPDKVFGIPIKEQIIPSYEVGGL